MEATASGPLGPILRGILEQTWDDLFNSGNALYLPSIILQGDPSLGLPSYDPVTITSESPLQAIGGATQDLANSACASLEFPVNPLGILPMSMSLGNLVVTGLHALSPGSLRFSATSPSFLVSVSFGSLGETEIPLQFGPNGTSPNFQFQGSCCEPATSGAPCDASSDQWTVSASGQFTMSVTSGTARVAVTLAVTADGPPVVAIDRVSLSWVAKSVTINPQVANLAPWAESLLTHVVGTNQAADTVLANLNAYLNGAGVLGNIEAVVNSAIAKHWPSP